MVYDREEEFDENSKLGKQFYSLDNEHKESNEMDDGNSLPLCYVAFELIKEDHKLTKAEKQYKDSLKWKQPSLILNDLISDYLDGFYSHSDPPLVVCETENKCEEVLIKQSFSFDMEHREDHEILDQGSLPLCFSSFEIIKENYKVTKEENKQVNKSWKPSPEVFENVVCNIVPFFSPQSPLLRNIQFENAAKSVEHEELIENHVASLDPMYDKL